MPCDNNKKSFSDESLKFRRLPKEMKYKKLLDFCIIHSQTPRTYKRPEAERVMGQFLVNMKASAKKNSNSIEEWEHKYLHNISKYEIYQRDPKVRLNDILKWSNIHKKTPSQSSQIESERKLAQSLNSIKLSNKKNKLNATEINLLGQILKYRTNHQRTRSEKLADVLEFCRKKHRTPRQHVKDKNEKRLAEFLTTTKGLLKTSKFLLDKESNDLYNTIMSFAPPTREMRIQELYDFVHKERRKPSMSSDDVTERRLAAYLSKMKTAINHQKLSDVETKLVNGILSICQIKTRAHKLNELLEWTLNSHRYPNFKNADTVEKRLAVFLNNIKQVEKKRPKSLSKYERDIINRINSSIVIEQGV